MVQVGRAGEPVERGPVQAFPGLLGEATGEPATGQGAGVGRGKGQADALEVEEEEPELILACELAKMLDQRLGVTPDASTLGYGGLDIDADSH